MAVWRLSNVILIPIFLSAVLKITDGWRWSWRCVEGKCVRSEDGSSHGVIQDMGQTLEVCRLTCGQYGALWPRPTGPTSLSDRVIPFHPGRVIFNLADVAGRRVPGKRSSIAQEFLAFTAQSFVSAWLEQCGANCSNEFDNDVTVRITTNSSDTALHWQTDESYSLHVETQGSKVDVHIVGRTIYGARHGMETLNQLISGYSSDAYNYLVIVSVAKISDKPVYGHRGLMLDTARHFIPVDMILRTLDAMAMSKLNVLHWHATDSQSFPLDVPSFPEFARYGAYSSAETYSPSEMKEIVGYGRDRGIRVIVEIDAPAHAGNGWQWGPGAGLGDLAVCVNKQPWRKFCVQPPCGQLNPVNPNTYKVLRSLYRDLIAIFSRREMFHMGGDEVAFSCWNSTVEIRQWLEKHNRTKTTRDYLKLWTEFQDHALKIYDEEVNSTKTPIILWSSELTQPDTITLDPNRYIIETWTERKKDVPQRLLAKGYRIIVASKDVWYLDHGFWGSTKFSDWRNMYNYRLPAGAGVLGGEVGMWSEYVDENNMEPRVWPRAAAVAERLWSDPGTSSQQAQPRFLAHRQRLVKRGINAAAVLPQWCEQHDQECS
ncbi:unnamed protein product [Bemisia tabaci]|uniref:beta-N-acetylhexosaminidase n=1 Tax=Bemisia tabaci TaxID=7038 RepID=A0A9P0AG53_BEMTA|nr:unnamed protein product [Bemisia tabaci]